MKTMSRFTRVAGFCLLACFGDVLGRGRAGTAEIALRQVDAGEQGQQADQ